MVLSQCQFLIFELTFLIDSFDFNMIPACSNSYACINLASIES